MNKWTKYDTRFILRSLSISVFAILIWSYFSSYQINNNYLHIDLNDKEAKQKALQYIGSRGWDISGYTFACKYSQEWGGLGYWSKWNLNYTPENIADKNKDMIKEIQQLSGSRRWNMRWYNPPNEDEIKISYTKDGDLTFFYHILPDTLAGDSLPEDIAYNIAKMFLKDMTGTEWKENDWDIKNKGAEQKPNRLDYYFQWENNKYNFDGATIRMSIRVHGNEVVRYNRWLDTDQSGKNYEKEFINWATISDFFDDIREFINISILIISVLLAVFYLKILTNWKIAGKFAFFSFIISLISRVLMISHDIYDFSSEDLMIASISNYFTMQMLNIIQETFFIFIVVATCEKLYRNAFPNFISFSNLFNLKVFTSKMFFNNFLIGIVSALCTVALTTIFYFCVYKSGIYIAYQHLDFNHMLTSSPLIYLITSAIQHTLLFIIPYVVLVLLIHLLSKSKWLPIVLASIIYSINGIMDTDPVFIACIYLFIIGLISGHLLYKYGIISLLVFEFSRSIFSEVFLYFFTNQEYYIATGIIIIILLLSPVFYSLLHYLKFRSSTSTDKLLNSSENTSEEKTSEPIIPKLEGISHPTNKWAWILFVLGIGCLFIPNNDELKNTHSYAINKSQAINTAKAIIENNYKGDTSGFQAATNYWDYFNWNSWDNDLGPLDLPMNSRSWDLAYLKENVGREGIKHYIEKFNISRNGWLVKFYKPNEEESYIIAMDPRTNKAASFFFHKLPDTMAVSSVERSEAESIISNTLAFQNIDITQLSIQQTFEVNSDHRVDQSFEYKNEVSLQNQFKLEELISTMVGGNMFTFYDKNIKVPEEWKREYMTYNLLFIICSWLPTILLIASILIGMYYLIRNTSIGKYQISWPLLGTAIFSVVFINVTWFINKIPVNNARYWGASRSWLVHWVDRIGNNLEEISFLCLLTIIIVSCSYFANPRIKKLFSKQSKEAFSKDALTSCIATAGALLLCYPIQYILYSLFPNYIDLSALRNYIHNIHTYYPGYGLLTSIMIETLFLFTLSIIYYQKILEYSANGNNIKKNLILVAVSAFYLFFNCFIESPIAMIPHFLSRFSGLVLFLMLVKYFWKGNPLSHLFGILIYFQLDRIFAFISSVDPTTKPQGWVLLILLVVIFIYTVGIEAFRDRFVSKNSLT